MPPRDHRCSHGQATRASSEQRIDPERSRKPYQRVITPPRLLMRARVLHSSPIDGDHRYDFQQTAPGFHDKRRGTAVNAPIELACLDVHPSNKCFQRIPRFLPRMPGYPSIVAPHRSFFWQVWDISRGEMAAICKRQLVRTGGYRVVVGTRERVRDTVAGKNSLQRIRGC